MQGPKPYPKPELPKLDEVRAAGGNTASIHEDAEKEPVIRDILEIFDGEVLNNR